MGTGSGTAQVIGPVTAAVVFLGRNELGIQTDRIAPFFFQIQRNDVYGVSVGLRPDVVPTLSVEWLHGTLGGRAGNGSDRVGRVGARRAGHEAAWFAPRSDGSRWSRRCRRSVTSPRSTIHASVRRTVSRAERKV